jgi:hypothetical protein
VRTKNNNSNKLIEQLQCTKDTIERLQSEKEAMFTEWERDVRQFKKDIINLIRSKKQSTNQELYDMIAD